MMLELYLLLVIMLVGLIDVWQDWKSQILKNRGIPHRKPHFLLGNLGWKIIWRRSSFMRLLIDQHMRHRHKKVYGIYVFLEPGIYIRDRALVRKIAIRDFDKFSNHRNSFHEVKENIFAKSLVALQDKKWKEMRRTLTPCYTSSKMRLMFHMINDCCLEGVESIKLQMRDSRQQSLDLEMADYFTKFTNDVIASTAFGIKVNSFKDTANDFITTALGILGDRRRAFFKNILYFTIPAVMRFLRIDLINMKRINYFNDLVIGAMKQREQNNIVRPDMINLLIEAKRNFAINEVPQPQDSSDHVEFNDEDILAQCLLFFLAGFQTVTTCLCYTTYELLMNATVQERLYKEILDIETALDGKPLSYDDIIGMNYLDMVISESLRKWPPASVTDRVCASDYDLIDDEGDLVAKLKQGDRIFIPILGFHRDPNNFRCPDLFDPERFSPERKNLIAPMSYIPFGVGPRNCIGNRFAIMEIKSIIYHLVLNFKIVAAKNTSKDIMSNIRGFQMLPKDLFWVTLLPRAEE